MPRFHPLRPSALPALVLTASLALAGLLPASAAAQSIVSPFVAGGIANPSGDLSDSNDAGWVATGGLVLGFPVFPLDLEGALSYQSLPGKDGVAGPGDFTQLGIHANARLALDPIPLFDIYGTGGIGYYQTEDDLTESDWNVGFNLGAGASFGAGGAGLFIEARWHRVETDGESVSTLPIVVGIVF